MTPTTPRAPRMGRDDRRRMLVARTTELLADTGRPVNTREIARAAGIGEGTVFRAFADKDELLNECLFEAMRMEQATDQVRALPVEGELRERLVAAEDEQRRARDDAAEAERVHTARRRDAEDARERLRRTDS